MFQKKKKCPNTVARHCITLKFILLWPVKKLYFSIFHIFTANQKIYLYRLNKPLLAHQILILKYFWFSEFENLFIFLIL